jgi:IMP dehydrogenase
MIEGLEFKDVLILPRISTIKSRSEINLSHTFTGHGVSLQLETPLFSAPMEGIVSKELIVALGENGACGILHRGYKSVGDWCRDIDYIASKNVPFGISVGIGDEHNIIDYSLRKGANIILVDVAHGNMVWLHEYLKSIAKKVHKNNALLMSGNVVEFTGANALRNSEVDLIRCGIGSGNLCSTREKTSIGCPQITAIQNCVSTGLSIISDGGIRSAGDAVKAFASGASGIMLGSLLANCYESGHEGEIRGQASKEYQEEFYGEHKSIEGVVKKAEKNISVKDFIKDFSMNLKSACSYLGVNKLDEVSSVAEFIKVR